MINECISRRIVATCRVGVLGLLCCSSSAFAQRAAIAEKECYQSGGHADARQCLEGKAKQSAVKLDEAEESVRSGLRKVGEPAEEIARALAAFEASSVAFRQYRDKQCEFMAALAMGGNAASDRRLLCEIELNMRRTTDLSEAHGGISISRSGPL